MAAEVLLASALLADGELDGMVDGGGKMGDQDAGEIRLGTGVEGCGVLGGGVVGVWGDGGEVVRRMLVDALIKRPESMAAVVDTSGNFDVVGVYKGILERLKRDVKVVGEEKEEDVAAKVLDRVKIMRVFDFVGVREAIAEIREDLDGRKKDAGQKPVRTSRRRTPEPARSPKRPTPEPLTPEPLPKRTVVADSEDEDDDDEMLFNTAPGDQPPEKSVPSVQKPQPTTSNPPESIPQQDEPAAKVTFILIDNLASVLTPVFKKDYIQGNTLASTFLHSLNHLTCTHTLHTILSNPVQTPRSSSPIRNLASLENKQQVPPPPPPSIFASNTALPSLLGVLARYVDVGLMVSSMPKGKMDAKVYYRDGNGNGGNGIKKLRGVEMMSVVEVLWDRWEGRGGDWGVVL